MLLWAYVWKINQHGFSFIFLIGVCTASVDCTYCLQRIWWTHKLVDMLILNTIMLNVTETWKSTGNNEQIKNKSVNLLKVGVRYDSLLFIYSSDPPSCVQVLFNWCFYLSFPYNIGILIGPKSMLTGRALWPVFLWDNKRYFFYGRQKNAGCHVTHCCWLCGSVVNQFGGVHSIGDRLLQIICNSGHLPLRPGTWDPLTTNKLAICDGRLHSTPMNALNPVKIINCRGKALHSFTAPLSRVVLLCFFFNLIDLNHYFSCICEFTRFLCYVSIRSEFNGLDYLFIISVFVLSPDSVHALQINPGCHYKIVY